MVQEGPAIHRHPPSSIAIASLIVLRTALIVYVFEPIETLGKEIPCLTLAWPFTSIPSAFQPLWAMYVLRFVNAPKQCLT